MSSKYVWVNTNKWKQHTCILICRYMYNAFGCTQCAVKETIMICNCLY